MNETNKQEAAYSGERVETTPVDCPVQVATAALSSTAQMSERSSIQRRMGRLSGWLETEWDLRYITLAEVTGFLKRTKRLWLTGAAVVIALLAVVTLAQRLSEWARDAREKRHEWALATVTPDGLIARCGAAAQDTTKEVYPIVMRTMSYEASGNRKLTVAFSRTAEQKSDWVFLSINDDSGTGRYDTPDAKIAALPCLDSTR